MGLIGNINVLSRVQGHSSNALASRGFSPLNKPASLYAFYVQDRVENRTQQMSASFPTGTEPPYSYMLAYRGGELSSTTYANGSSTVTSSLLLGKIMEANLSGSGDLSASMSLITSILASLSGSSTLSGSLSTSLSLAANLIGSGSLSGSLSMLIPLASALSGSGSVSANLKGNLDMEAQIYVNQSEATVDQIVSAVWNAVASDYNTSGTMGQKLNGAGSAGDPWTTDLSGYNTADTAGLILKQAKAKAALASALSA